MKKPRVSAIEIVIVAGIFGIVISQLAKWLMGD
jgi:hypothetical protein